MLKYHPVSRVIDLLQGHEIPTVPVYLNKEELLPIVGASTYLGDPQPYGRETRSGRLSRDQVQILNQIGIKAEAGDYVEKGLVTATTKTGTLDLLEIHKHVVSVLSLAITLPESDLGQDISQLLAGLALGRSAIATAVTQPTQRHLLRNLRQEQQVQYAQLGALVLPAGLISKMNEPVSFVENTVHRLGQLAELILP